MRCLPKENLSGNRTIPQKGCRHPPLFREHVERQKKQGRGEELYYYMLPSRRGSSTLGRWHTAKSIGMVIRRRRIEDREVVTDEGYHSNDVLKDFEELDFRTYCSEPDRGGQNWCGQNGPKLRPWFMRTGDESTVNWGNDCWRAAGSSSSGRLLMLIDTRPVA
jgi:hypothetical protein